MITSKEQERAALNELRDRYDVTERYNARDEAWSDLQDLAEKHGYGSRFCSLDSGMEHLMQSQSDEVRMKALKLYGTYCAVCANVEAASAIGLTLANIDEYRGHQARERNEAMQGKLQEAGRDAEWMKERITVLEKALQDSCNRATEWQEIANARATVIEELELENIRLKARIYDMIVTQGR